jgi:hypothetical protein
LPLTYLEPKKGQPMLTPTLPLVMRLVLAAECTQCGDEPCCKASAAACKKCHVACRGDAAVRPMKGSSAASGP